MTRKRNQIVALYMKPEDAYCVQELLNVKSAILSQRLRDFARGGDADNMEDATITISELNQCSKLAIRLHGKINKSLKREADGEEEDWLENIYTDRYGN